MGLWTTFVDALYTTLFGLSVVLGGNMGLAIAVFSLGLRLLLLPLTLRFAYRSLEMQAALKKLEPELAHIRKQHRDDPKRLWEETARLHQKHGVRLFEGRTLLFMLVQVPLFLGLFGAVRRGLANTRRFLWIKDLMKADPLLAGICAILTGLSSVLGSHHVPEQQRTVTMVLPALLTFLFLWRLSAGITIYTLSSSLVGLLQSLLVRRRFAKSHA